jgi:hypothetical protein
MAWKVGRSKGAAIYLLILLRVRLSNEKNPPKCRVPRALCLKQIWKVGKVGKVGGVGKVGKKGKEGRL